MEKEKSAEHFLDLVRRSRRGKFKIYIGMIAGVGKSYRMLMDAHEMLNSGINVQIGYIETHGRSGTEQLLPGLPIIPRKKIFYKGKELEEMDLTAIIQKHPEVVIVDELAHTNVEGSRNQKRWQDVMELLEAGISVISAVNIQHIESLSEDVKGITSIDVKERIPDSVLQEADEVVNIDLTAEELIARLKSGKIYKPENISAALNNFFKTEHILQLREMALKEVAFRVEKKVESQVSLPPSSRQGIYREKILACITSNEHTPRHIIRKAYRIASRYNTDFMALYVQTPRERPDRITLAAQRYLLNHFKLVTELGGEIIQVSSSEITESIIEVCKERQVTTLCMGHPEFKMPGIIFNFPKYKRFLSALAEMHIDLIIIA
ncbi:MAG: sensor protein KdpD [Bacteroidales bacterium]